MAGVGASSALTAAGVTAALAEHVALVRVAETATVSLAGVGVAGLLGVAAVRGMGKFARPPIETSMGDLFEGVGIDAEGFVEDKDGGLWAVVGFEGVDFGSVSTGTVQTLHLMRHKMWRSLIELDLIVVQPSRRDAVEVKMEAEYGQPYRQWLADCWAVGFGQVFGNRHYIMLGSSGRKARERLRAGVREVVEGMGDYGARQLTNTGERSELLSYFASMMNGRPMELAPAVDHLGDRLANGEVRFNLRTGRVVFTAGGRRYIGACVGVKEWGAEDGAALVNGLLMLPGHVEVVTVARPLKRKITAQNARREKRIQNPLFLARAVEQDYDDAVELVGAGDDDFCEVQVLVFVYADDEEDLDDLLSMVRRTVKQAGHEPGHDVGTIRYLWRMRLPGAQTNVRGRRLKCGDLANLLWWESEPQGFDRTPWGDGPLQCYRTRTGSVYMAGVHARVDIAEPPANTITIAPIGSGKTVLWCHLALGALKYRDARVYFCDSGEGARVFIEALGGRYVHVGDEADVQFNPLHFLDTRSDRQFAAQFLRQLAGNDSDDAIQESETAVEKFSRLRRKSDRRLSKVFKTGFDNNGALKDGLKTWATGEGLGRLFNGETDTLDIEGGSDLVGFAFDRIIDDPKASAALVNYIMWRIRRAAESTVLPHMIVVDEAPRLTEDAVLATHIKRLIREQRKKKGSVNLIYQDVGGLMGSLCGPAALDNAQTLFVFPNPNASYEDFKVLGFSEEQTEILRGRSAVTAHLRRWCWVKRGAENVIIDTDLSGLGKGLALYRGGTEPVRVMHEMQVKYGAEGWVAGYLEELG